MSTHKEAVLTEHAPQPIGPYSQAIRSGEWLFCSGQIPLDPSSGTIVGTDARAQTEQVVRNVSAVLAAEGLGWPDVVKTTIFLKSMGDFPIVNEVYGAALGGSASPPPARSTVEVARLPKDVLVEIEVIARG